MKITKRKGKEKTVYGIIGLGRFGTALAQTLAESGAELIVIDNDEGKVREIRELTENAYVVQSLDKKSLAETGIAGCDIAVVCIGEQMDVSILTTLNLISLGVGKVISKARSAEHGEILEKLGAEVVYPEHDMALRLATRLETSRVLDYMQLNEQLNISKLELPTSLAGKTVVEADLRGSFGLNIVAIEHGGEVSDFIRPDTLFRAGDVLIVAGSKTGIAKLSELN